NQKRRQSFQARPRGGHVDAHDAPRLLQLFGWTGAARADPGNGWRVVWAHGFVWYRAGNLLPALVQRRWLELHPPPRPHDPNDQRESRPGRRWSFLRHHDIRDDGNDEGVPDLV